MRLLILAILTLTAFFLTWNTWLKPAEGEEHITDAAYYEIQLNATMQHILDSATWSYEWSGCYQGTTTCEEYKVKVSATVK